MYISIPSYVFVNIRWLTPALNKRKSDSGDNIGDDDDDDDGAAATDVVYMNPCPERTKKIDGPGTAGKMTDAP
ncbi:hypothetical protein Hanom_Chr09g00856031 [Helianthus anomalus]